MGRPRRKPAELLSPLAQSPGFQGVRRAGEGHIAPSFRGLQNREVTLIDVHNVSPVFVWSNLRPSCGIPVFVYEGGQIAHSANDKGDEP